MKGISISTQERNKHSKIQDYPLQDHYYIPVLTVVHVDVNSSIQEGDILTSCNQTNSIYHSPVTGVITKFLNFNDSKYIEIKRDQNATPRIYPKTSLYNVSTDVLLDRIKNAGIPAYQQLSQAQNNVTHIVINGLESDFFITTHIQLLHEKAQEIIKTAFQLKKILNASQIIITITKNSKLKNHIESFILDNSISLIEVPNIFPLAEERLLIKQLFNIEISKHQSTIDQQIIVLNPETIMSIYNALFYQKPQIEKIISIDGAYSLIHGNFRVKIGTPITAFMRPFSAENSYVMFSGGILTGEPLDKEKSLLKHMNAIMIFEGQTKPQETYCISCFACHNHCPINLEPIKLVDYIQHKEYDLADQNHIQECIFCNICTYVCPSYIPIGQNIKDYIMQGKLNA